MQLRAMVGIVKVQIRVDYTNTAVHLSEVNINVIFDDIWYFIEQHNVARP